MVSNAGIITTIAGTGALGSSGDGGAATSAQLLYPHGVSVDISGKVYIADTWNHKIRMVSNAGIITTIAGAGAQGSSGDGGASINAQLNTPNGVSVDISGKVYIADIGNNKIRMVTSTGIITAFAGTGAQGSSGDGGAATSAQLNYPEGVSVDISGKVYIADTGNNKIRMVSNTGIITAFAGTGTEGANGDDGAATSAQLFYPNGVAVDISGNVYIVDNGNNKIRMVTSTGIITAFAGTGGDGSSGDGGAATSAQLYYPSGVSVDVSGKVYIADYSNNKIRMVFQPEPSAMPSSQPSQQPTQQPSHQPTQQPTRQPTGQPTLRPTIFNLNPNANVPTGQPSRSPSKQPTQQPSLQPTTQPTTKPSSQPSRRPSHKPSGQPSVQPSMQPSRQPSRQPSEQPSSQPSRQPSIRPSSQPSRRPISQPSQQPNSCPSLQPSVQPTTNPTTSMPTTSTPTPLITKKPTIKPSSVPSTTPTSFGMVPPTPEPTTLKPTTATPTYEPTYLLTAIPTSIPSSIPSTTPTSIGMVSPTTEPTTLKPTKYPTYSPTFKPTQQPTTAVPLYSPTPEPTHPTFSPTIQPTHPTYEPTVAPSTISPTVAPSKPSLNPSFAPISANAPIATVQATQTVGGVTSDSADFRTAFASAVMSLLPTGSTVTIVSVTVVDVRHRQLLTKAVSVVYTVQSTAPASTLTSSLSTGTATMTAVLQQSYPAATVATPIVVSIANPTTLPTTAPVPPSLPSGGKPSAEASSGSSSSPSISASNASSGGSLVSIIAGAAGGGGLLLLLGLGYLFYRRNVARQAKESQIHAAASPDTTGGGRANYEIQDAELGLHGDNWMEASGPRKLRTSITHDEMTTPSINVSGATIIGSKLQSTVNSIVALDDSTMDNAAGGGPGPSRSRPTPKSATASTLPSIEWSALAPSVRIGSGSFSAVCKYP